MIKFFRHIRQSLIMENKTGKYLKYAIGEIVLVVIGILIALQINNWNEDRKSSRKEAAIIANIHKEFKENRQQLDSVTKEHQKVYENCKKIIALFPIQKESEQAVLDSLSHYLFWSWGGVTFNPSQSSIRALTNTSSFDIIKNERLRNLLISWNDLVIDYEEEEEASREYVLNRYDPYFAEHFAWDINFKDPRADIDVLGSLQFEYLVKGRFDLVDQILYSSGELQKVQQTLDEIIRLSEPEPVSN